MFLPFTLPLIFHAIDLVDWFSCPAEHFMHFKFVIASLGWYLICSSIPCLSCQWRVWPKGMIRFMVKRFWQEYFIGDAVLHTGPHRRHIITSCPAGAQSTHNSKTWGFPVVVCLFFSPFGYHDIELFTYFSNKYGVRQQEWILPRLSWLRFNLTLTGMKITSAWITPYPLHLFTYAAKGPVTSILFDFNSLVKRDMHISSRFTTAAQKNCCWRCHSL